MNKVIKSLKQQRLSIKLNQADLGGKLGLPQSHISKIEQGATDPRLSTVTDMARLLGLELRLVPIELISAVDTLITGEDDQQVMWSVDEDDDDDDDDDDDEDI